MELIKIKNNEIIINEDLAEELRKFEKQKILMDIKQKKLKEELKEAMIKHNVEKFQYVSNNGGIITATLKKAYERTSIDSTRLKKELPDIAEEYSKTTQVSESIELKVQ